MLVLSRTLPKKYPHKLPKFAVVINPSLIWRPRPGEPPRISPYILYFQKLESLAYISVANSISLSSFKFVQWAPKDASFPQQSAFWPFKVIQGHPSRWFWYQSKARMRLAISPSLWLWSYLAPFLRYGDLLAKNAYFSYPSLIRRPRSVCSLESFWHSASVWRRTDRQTDGRIYYS